MSHEGDGTMENQARNRSGRSFRLSPTGGHRTAAIPMVLLPNIMKRSFAHLDSAAAAIPGALAIVDGCGAVIGLGLMGADLEIGQRRAAGYAFGDVQTDSIYLIGTEGRPTSPWPHLEIVETIEGPDGSTIA